jgi:hypothetical protein
MFLMMKVSLKLNTECYILGSELKGTSAYKPSQQLILLNRVPLKSPVLTVL